MAEALAVNQAVPASDFPVGGLGQRWGGALSLKSVNRALYLLAILAAVYFVLVIFGGAVKLMGVSRHIHQLEVSGSKLAAVVTSPAKFEIKPADPALGNRNVFQPAGVQQVLTEGGTADFGSTGAYRLVGISEAKDPADTYVMVENSQTKMTYFLQYGQLVEGLELEKILEDKVIVKIGGDSVELK